MHIIMLSNKAYQNIFVRVKNKQEINFTQVIFEHKQSQENLHLYYTKRK